MFKKKISFKGEGIKYIIPSWDDIHDLAFNISKKMLNDNQKFDRIITLAKGGWPMTRSLVDFLQVDQVASIGVKFYGGINTHLEKPIVYQDIPVTVAGENILLFDDVADSGKSLEFAIKYLKDKKIGKITTATLFYKPKSSLVPDYFGEETNEWIIFPYDTVEAINILGNKWRKQGIDDSEIKNRFRNLNFKDNLVEYYFL